MIDRRLPRAARLLVEALYATSGLLVLGAIAAFAIVEDKVLGVVLAIAAILTVRLLVVDGVAAIEARHARGGDGDDRGAGDGDTD